MIKYYFILLTLVLSFYHSSVKGETGLDSPPIPVSRVSPKLPKGMSKKNMVHGHVKVQLEINEKGVVENPFVIDSEPKGVYDEVALEAALKFKFKPAMKAGKPIRFTATQTFEFEAPNDQNYNVGLNLEKYDPKNLDFSLHRFKKKGSFHSTLIIKDNETILKKLPMPTSENDWPMLNAMNYSPYLFFYHNLSRTKSKLKIYKRSDLTMVHDLDIPPLSQTKYGGSGYKALYFMLNKNELIIAAGKKKPQLFIIDGKSGTIIPKNKFDKNTLFNVSDDGKYLFARKVHSVPGVAIDSKLFVFKIQDFELAKEVSLKEVVENIKYIGGILELTFHYKSTTNDYRVMYLRLSDGEYIGDYRSSVKPKYFEEVGLPKARFVVGTSSDGKFLNIGKLEKRIYSELTNNEIEIKYNQVQIRRNGLDSSLLFYGRNKFLKFNLFDPTKSVSVDLPINVAVGFFNRDYSTAYLSEYHGAKIAVVNITDGHLVATDKSKLGGLKFGMPDKHVRSLRIPVPPGYTNVSMKNGFHDTENILMLDTEEDRLFVLRVSSSYLTSFNASDLSDKKTIDTGRQSFQLIQKADDPEAPVIAIGISQITFIHPKTGDVISYFEYDSPKEITKNDELFYIKDGQAKLVSIENLMTYD